MHIQKGKFYGSYLLYNLSLHPILMQNFIFKVPHLSLDKQSMYKAHF